MPLTQEDLKRIEEIAENTANRVIGIAMKQHKLETDADYAEMKASIDKLIDMFTNGKLEERIQRSFRASLSDPIFENKLKGFVDMKLESVETSNKIRGIVKEHWNSSETEKKINEIMKSYVSTSVMGHVVSAVIGAATVFLAQFISRIL